MNVAYNMDCLPAMRETPDNFYDLAVCDPPYGDGMGGNPDRFGGVNSRFEKYKPAVENRGGVNHGTGSDNGLTGTNKVSRTGGTWAAKFGKKS